MKVVHVCITCHYLLHRVTIYLHDTGDNQLKSMNEKTSNYLYTKKIILKGLLKNRRH